MAERPVVVTFAYYPDEPPVAVWEECPEVPRPGDAVRIAGEWHTVSNLLWYSQQYVIALVYDTGS